MGRPFNEVTEQIGKELRDLYAELIAEPVPARFLDLLKRLDRAKIASLKKAKHGRT